MSNASPKLIYHGAYEGNAYSKLRRYIAAKGYNANLEVLLAIVTKAAPDLEITLDCDGLALDKDYLVVSRHLTNHKRMVRINGASEPVEIEYVDELQVGDRVFVIEDEENGVYYVLDIAHWY